MYQLLITFIIPILFTIHLIEKYFYLYLSIFYWAYELDSS